MEVYTELLKYFFPSVAAAIVAFGLIAKYFFEFLINKRIEVKKSELEQEVEAFRQRLQQESDKHKLELDKNLEEYRNHLEILRLQNQVMFSQLHEKRGEVLQNLYKKLINFDSLLYELTKPLKMGNDFKKEEEDRKIRTSEAFNDFNNYYNENRIYFGKITCDLLDKLRADFKKHLKDYTEKDFFISLGAQGDELVQASIKAAMVWEKVQKEIPPALRSLEDEFRRILGVPEESNTVTSGA